MIDIVLVFQWRLGRYGRDDFYKRVKFPALPPIGSTIWLDEQDDGEFGESIVEAIHIHESIPNVFDVLLAMTIVDEEDDDIDFVKWMESHGWSKEKHKAIQ